MQLVSKMLHSICFELLVLINLPKVIRCKRCLFPDSRNPEEQISEPKARGSKALDIHLTLEEKMKNQSGPLVGLSFVQVRPVVNVNFFGGNLDFPKIKKLN